jgi:malic enzyme
MRQRVWMFDDKGLVVATRSDLPERLLPYAHSAPPGIDIHAKGNEFQQIAAAIKSFKPTAIIGTSTVGGLFNRLVVEAMSAVNDRPIVFALSNPTAHAECLPEDVYRWSNGKPLYAAGVQFPPVQLDGKTFLPGQANNLYILPAINLAFTQRKPGASPTKCSLRPRTPSPIRSLPINCGKACSTRRSRTSSRPKSAPPSRWRLLSLTQILRE